MTVDLIDQRKIATELSQRAIDRIITAGEKVIKEYWARYKNRDVSTYADYLVRKGVHANAVRNFIYDTRSASLYDIYVPTMIKDERRTGDQLIQFLCEAVEDPKKRQTRAMAIVGNAGTGKSLFMKHAFFEIQRLDSNRIPVLIEVRSFNRVPLANLETRIYEDFNAIGTSITREQVTSGLRSGLFVILLDGMDELKGAIQSHYEGELTGFAEKFPLCPILVSSRPSQRVLSSAFDVRPIAPLDIAAAENLIARLDFDEKVKIGFTELLRKILFRSHYEFASVPLLCTIMLLTFSDSGRVANDRHEFFEDAFTALWSKHDGRKDGFERHRHTGLQKNEFVRLLSAFAISSYSSGDYDMRPAQFHRHFLAAVRLSGLSCKEEEFLQDLTVSTSLAIQDGPYIRFCHLSFQEYFTAVFLSETDDSIVGRLIEDLSDRLETDNVLPLLLSINDEKIEKHWVVPKAQIITACIETANGDIDKYAHIVAGTEGTASDASIAMRQIRTLYHFEPSTGSLLSAYDAARDMKFSVKRLMQRSSPKNRVFEHDRSNFLSLGARIIKKYEHRSSALQDLLSRTATPL